MIDDIPIHRLTAPAARAFGEAGMLAGLPHGWVGCPTELALINEALLYLHVREMENIGGFDQCDEVLPGSSVRLYRAM